MAITDVAEQHYRSRQKIELWDHDPGTTDATVTTPDGGTTKRWVDMRDHTRIAVGAMATIFGAASGITKLELVAADDTAGTNLTVIRDSGTVDADAIGDWLMLECDVSDIAHASSAGGYSLRYAGARITCSHAGDEAAVLYIAQARYPNLDHTPATTIS